MNEHTASTTRPRPPRSLPQRAQLLAAVLIASLIAAMAMVTLGPSSSTATPALSASVSTLDRVPESIPAEVSNVVEHLMSRSDLTALNRAIDSPGSTVWTSSLRNGEICIAHETARGFGGTCRSQEVLARTPIFIQAPWSDERAEIAGVVPDGVVSISIDGEPALEVTNNAFASLDAPRYPTEFTVTLEDGETRTMESDVTRPPPGPHPTIDVSTD